ncbi:A24 family peptidase [Eubacteriaceae bacterium ES2]|nr:A24 family peptidase [Eubacteriaceae bacterium ES2]
MPQTLGSLLILLAGMGFGLLIKFISDMLIKKRLKQLMTVSGSIKNQEMIFFSMTNGLIWWLFFKQYGIESQAASNMLLFSIALMIALVDLKIQKIPNELLLLEIIIGIGLIISTWPDGDPGIRIAGFVIGFVIFMIPALIGRAAGWGDVKYAAVVGFCLGIQGLILAILMMSIAVIFYAIIFLVRKREDLKKRIALGPFITLGFSMVLVFNLMA